MWIFAVFAAAEFTIDFGSFYTKSCYVTEEGSVEMLLDRYKSVNTPTFVAFKTPKTYKYEGPSLTEAEIKGILPIIGYHAFATYKSRPWLGRGFLPAYIDLTLKGAAKFSNSLGIADPQISRFDLFNSTATYLHFYAEEMLGNRFDKENTTIVIPATFTVPQREFLLEAAKAAGLNNPKLIEDWEATAHYYIHKMSNEILQGERRILFIDNGATSAKSYVIRFAPSVGETFVAYLVKYVTDYETGGAYISERIANLFAKTVGLEKLIINQKISLFETSEIGKKSYSVNQISDFIYSDIDGKQYSHTFCLEEIESVIFDLNEKMISNALNAIPFQYSIDSVEVIGGSSQSKIFIKNIEQYLDPEKIHINEKYSEILARGAAYSVVHEKTKGLVTIKKNHSMYTVSTCNFNECMEICLKGECIQSYYFPKAPPNGIFNLNFTMKELRKGLKHPNLSYQANVSENHELHVGLYVNPLRVAYTKDCVASISCKEVHFEPLFSNFTNSDYFVKHLSKTNGKKEISILMNSIYERTAYYSRNDILEECKYELPKNNFTELLRFIKKAQVMINTDESAINIDEARRMIRLANRIDKAYIGLKEDSEVKRMASETINEFKDVLQRAQFDKHWLSPGELGVVTKCYEDLLQLYKKGEAKGTDDLFVYARSVLNSLPTQEPKKMDFIDSILDFFSIALERFLFK